MEKDKSKTETNATENIEETETVVDISTIDDIASIISDLEANSTTGPAARSYTARRGFKSMTALVNTDPKILAVMSGSISSALAQQAADSVEGADQSLKLSIDYAKNVGKLTENMNTLHRYARAAFELGFAPNGVEDIDDMNVSQQARMVLDFIESTKGVAKNAPPKEFKPWAENLAAS